MVKHFPNIGDLHQKLEILQKLVENLIKEEGQLTQENLSLFLDKSSLALEKGLFDRKKLEPPGRSYKFLGKHSGITGNFTYTLFLQSSVSKLMQKVDRKDRGCIWITFFE